MSDDVHVRWLENLTNDDVGIVGGKNASLGEMIRHLRDEGVAVPGGFATTADAYRAFLEHNDLQGRIREITEALQRGDQSLEEAGSAIRSAFRHGEFPKPSAKAIHDAYRELSKRNDQKAVAVAVRSSATAEDLPEASFAGQQETFLNVRGSDDLLDACRDCYASLFTDRAISYRQEHGFDHLKVALSVGVQKMVRSDRAGAGVMFSLDTDTGFPDVVVINASWGLETVVQGSVDPDEYRVFKPKLGDKNLSPILAKVLGGKEKKIVYAQGGKKTTKSVDTPKKERKRLVLSDEEILTLARSAVAIEKHYEKPMDMEWAKDGESGELYCVQARPETVQSQKQAKSLQAFQLEEKSDVPFARSPDEADRVIETMAGEGLERGKNGLELYMMCEIPSNIFPAKAFAERFDGFSIGSNDLTQLVLGVDRDSEQLQSLFDERSEAVKRAIAQVIEEAHEGGCKVGICGQAPSDYPEFARFLIDRGINTISLNPDSVLDIIEKIGE
ncbi:MAG: PEP/pyruvate-binding domain-containing protein [Myxococcota bacterium]